MNRNSAVFTFKALSRYPPILEQEGSQILNQLKKGSQIAGNNFPATLEHAGKILPLSRFLATFLRKTPRMLIDPAVAGKLYCQWSKRELSREAASLMDSADEEALMAGLRSFRNRYMFLIAWRDLAGICNLEETMADITRLADTCLAISIEWHYTRLASRHGTPLYPDGSRQNLIVLAMGKLGAQELNFSSDIDLIFAYPLLGNTAGPGKNISNEEFFTFLARKVMKTLSQNTADGIVFRVDTRLRPFGDSGPLVMCADAVEEYYENYGRQWERYAMVKARAAAGDIRAGERLLRNLKPFVYKKYLDYSTIESLRQMKAMIMAEQDKQGAAEDIKLGPGGIRDAEFIVQTFQLLKGGRIPALQKRYFLRVLEHIERFSLLEKDTCRKLKDAYIFLRTVENRLQEYADQQVHRLPSDPDRQLRLAISTGFSEWEQFRSRLRTHMQDIHIIFTGLFLENKEPVNLARHEEPGQPEPAPAVADPKHFKALLNKCLLAWKNPQEPQNREILYSMGFIKSSDMLSSLRNSARIKVLPGRTKEILDQLMPSLLAACATTREPDKALAGSLRIIEAVLRRSIYLMLLNEYPQALFHLVELCSKSRWISDLISRQPILLDELIDAANLFRPLSREEIRTWISAVAGPGQDMELFLDEMRRIRKGSMLKVAACDLDGIMEVDVVGKTLTELAEVLLETCLKNALDHVLKQYPLFRDHGIRAENCAMAVIAYGKMGGREMSYGSDLDLVFLYDTSSRSFPEGADPGHAAYFFSRLVQRLIFLLTTRTSQGVLYQIDTRLRPNGSQGILVSSIEGFSEYQHKKAWVWEHQAIIRARFASGDKRTGDAFQRIRKDVLVTKRNRKDLATEVLSMRKRMAANVKESNSRRFFDIKKDPGGLIDIEFLVQYLVLLHAARHRELTSATGCLELLEILSELKLLSPEDRDLLTGTFKIYMKKVNHLTLDLQKARVSSDLFQEERRQVKAVCKRFLGSA